MSQLVRTVEETDKTPRIISKLTDLPPALNPKLDMREMSGVIAAMAQFPFKLPRHVLGQLRDHGPSSPILRQFLPSAEETRDVPGFGHDPVGDRAANVIPGLLHKYPGRVLIVATGSCAVHCRYCFRRHFPYEESRLNSEAIDRILSYVQQHSDIHEVILSGGDPLVLSVRRLGELLAGIDAIAHVKRLRIHSRVPTVMPELLTTEHLALLTSIRAKVVLVNHVNHPDELDDDSQRLFNQLRLGGVTLLNQSVLLRGVNDDVDTLCRLSERLFEQGVLPYYLHQLDKVAGAAHFNVSEERGCKLMAQLRTRLPGYLVPHYVRETAGEISKLPVRCKDEK